MRNKHRLTCINGDAVATYCGTLCKYPVYLQLHDNLLFSLTEVDEVLDCVIGSMEGET